MGITVTTDRHVIDDKDLELKDLDEIVLSEGSAQQILRVLVGATYRLYIHDIVVHAVDTDDTNDVTLSVIVDDTNASTPAEGEADTKTVAETNFVWSDLFQAAEVGGNHRYSIERLFAKGKDLIVKTAVGGSGTVCYLIIRYTLV